MKQVVVKFVVAKGTVSALMYWLCRHKYTHVAISIDDETFYSYTYAGFSTERKRRRLPTQWRENYAYYYIDVDDSTYELIKEKISEFDNSKHLYKYSHLGVIFAFLNIPINIKYGYFCSRFVAELIANTNTHKLAKKPHLYLPHELAREIVNCRRYEYLCN